MTYDMTLPHRKYFYEIAQHPHGSTNEKPLSDYLVSFAKEHGLAYTQDELYNVIIRKPATAGYENAPVLAIQAHMDMVCEKNKDTVHNFETDPIRFVVGEDGWLRADGTTLGADDCTGVAYMLSILADDSLEHPELECIFTTQEEIGMYGALALKPEEIKAHRMVTLDGGGETSTLLTSAGGCRVNINKKLTAKPNTAASYALRVRGLSGGHSGGEIHKEKGNANKLAVRILKEAMAAGFSLSLSEMEGGLKENAIPRECDVVFAFEGDFAALEQQVRASEKGIWQELEFSDNGFHVILEPVETAASVVEESAAVVDMLFLFPNGFINRSMAIEGLTMTSLNMGILRMSAENGLYVAYSLRSMLQSCIENLVNQLSTVCGIFGAELARGAEYPGWKYSEKSPMRDIMAAVVKDLYDGRELVVSATHGGCECGVFSSIHSDMDIISVGPIASGCHTPDEALDLESFDRTYKLLCEIVKRCK